MELCLHPTRLHRVKFTFTCLLGVWLFATNFSEEPGALFSRVWFLPAEWGQHFPSERCYRATRLHTWSHSKRQQWSSPYVRDTAGVLLLNLISIKTVESIWGSRHRYRQTAKQNLRFATQVQTNSETKFEVHDTGTDKQRNKIWGSRHRYRQTAKQNPLTWQSRSDVCRATATVVTLVCMQKQCAQYERIISMNVLRTPTCSRVSSWMKKRMALENRKLPDKWEMLLSLASQACTQLSDGKTQITTWNDSAVFFLRHILWQRFANKKNYNSVEASNSSEESAANINWLVRKFLRLFQKQKFRYTHHSVTALHPEPDAISSQNFVLYFFNPLNPELNPICYLLALLAHHFLHVSRIKFKSLTIRLLMSYIYIYIYGAPILDVSRSHTTTHHSR